ncbi:glycoside hydrolase family 36 protein [Lepidopterella palustris CBS 459.81]|uniref:Glycoside hydrolase family 36 protein n=1 Tax=Lepidopterella palustris CBS 459.81 TaxID=1314670 RepID=A0A8E2JEW7_9PEZI|nr:glycoside hydrolase family 36 protein [Lepidopterella palustris CBS 459.81]
MYAKLLCNPPLGQLTVVPPHSQSVRFTVLIETSIAHEKKWNVALWHNHNHLNRWESLTLKEIIQPSSLFLKQEETPDICHQWFAVELPTQSKPRAPVSFTVTFRGGDDEPWKWANDQFSTSDGQLLYETSAIQHQDLSEYIEDLPPYLNISKETSETPNTLLWSITSPVNAASGTASGYSDNKLGKPTAFLKWFSLVRIWSPWLAPRHGKDQFRPDKDAVLASFLRKDGSHLVVLAVSGIDDVLTTLHHDGEGGIVINSRNDSEKEGIARLIVAVAKSFEVANAAVMYHARKLVTQYEQSSGEMEAEMEAMSEGGMKAQWLENWYDGLAYCTWNGLGQHLTEQKIFDALDSLEKSDINVTNLIIDDNWQSLDHEGGNQFQNAWVEFEATKVGFPRGLKQTASDIRAKHKNIRHIAVWHALFGYWGGISPHGNIAREYKTVTVQKKDGVAGGKILVVAKEDVPRLYQDFYSFLSSAGIDSVKTDAQFFLDELDDATDRRNLIQVYQDAWTINNLRYFSAKAISCMSQTPQILFHSQMPTNKPRLLVRNSDDFFPEVPASHPWHIYCNAHNSLFTQHLNVLPDWDMFQTSHPWASFHAAARCVSGGPIYITDVPGQHDVNLIHQMTAKTPRGDTVILRPHTIGKTINAYIGYDEQVLLKIGTYVGMARTGTSILGIFNVSQRGLTEMIRLDQFPGTEEGSYIIRAHRTGQVSRPMSREDLFSFVHLDVPVQGWEILSACPVRSFKLERKELADGPDGIKVANLGLLGKMTGSAAIVNSDMYIERSSGRLRIWTSLKALGTYGLYISDLPTRNLKDDFMGLLFGRPIPLDCVKVNDKNPNVMEIDAVRAWKESDSQAGWSNEVAIEVVIR